MYLFLIFAPLLTLRPIWILVYCPVGISNNVDSEQTAPYCYIVYILLFVGSESDNNYLIIILVVVSLILSLGIAVILVRRKL